MIDNESNSQPEPKRAAHPRLTMLNWKRPRCPKCKGAALRKYRSISDQGDGSSLSWVRCRNDACEFKFRLLME